MSSCLTGFSFLFPETRGDRSQLSFAARQKHYLGFGQFGARQFVGGKHLIDQIEDKLKQQSTPISLVGIGGIG